MAKKATSQPLLAGFDDPAPAPAVAITPTPATILPTVPVDHAALDTHAVVVNEAALAKAPANEPLSLKGKRVYLVDAYSLIYQVFHALPEMTGPSGQPVGAAHGFVRDMLDLIENRGADLLIAAFDHPSATFRTELYTEYKANRQEMPVDLQPQIPLIKQFMDALGIPALALAGYEADDLLATLALQAHEAGAECLIVTSDKDCRQLITDNVRLYNIRKNEAMDAAGLLEVWGIRPNQVVDFQSLVGDSVDNVPGIPGIGPKTATTLLQKYETLEGVYEHLDELKGKQRENIEKGRESAFMSRDLVRLKADLELDFNWSIGLIGGMQPAVLAELNRHAGFKQLAKRMESLAAKFAGDALPTAPGPTHDFSSAEFVAKREIVASSPAAEVVSRPMVATADPWIVDYRTVATVEQLDELIEQMKQQKEIVIDTETTSLRARQAEIVGYSFCWTPGVAYYLPVRAPAGETVIDPQLALEKLRPVLEDPQIAKVGQNIKYDQLILRSAGVTLRGVAFDTMVADYLIDPGERSHNLDDLAVRHLGHQNITIDTLIGTGKNQKRMDEVPVAIITQYAAEDADVPLRLKAVLEPRLAEQDLLPLFHELEIPLIDVLAEMEFNGIRVDRERLKQLDEQFTLRIAALEKEIYEIAGAEFNIDSRLQLSKLLFEDLKLPIVKRTKTGPSTDVDVLEELARLHPLPAKIIDYRQNSKLQSTYVLALQELIHPGTGRVHTSFKQDVAATGRLSSQDPNLQNIPVRSEAGRAIRSAFLPGPDGWLLMTADYSQIELRVLAHFSGDVTLQQAFILDRDIHTQVASDVYGVPLEQVTREMRRNAKAINFGIIYGQSPFGLSKALDISQGDAAEFIEAYFSRLPGVEKFMEQVLLDCRRVGWVSTILGRRRPVQGVRDPRVQVNKRQRTLPERIAINTVIQGSAADIIKRAMINVHRRLAKEQLQSRLLLQIHDELVFEFPPDEQERLAQLVGEEMSTAAQLSVPLKVDVKTGPNWAACEVLE
ncbi:DNA polymerase I [Anatilimnocola aggregata]|uniref:DNA polymerase I n=1 Tax=Anatilimnocola aggregata TaxID=2528021 RepID=A0A517Y895_9BACT|nr:DNA polymerase I [Anatilimnocola aggregata]QDU26446.1 DNA polymerase I [Anatilimnocola aggregata]